MKTNSKSEATEEKGIGVLICRAYLKSIECITKHLRSHSLSVSGCNCWERIIATNMPLEEVGGNALWPRTLSANKMLINKVLKLFCVFLLSVSLRDTRLMLA